MFTGRKMSYYLGEYFRNSVLHNKTIHNALSKLSGSRCLITGANGIIGYALSRLIDAHTSAEIVLATRRISYKGIEYLSDKVKNVDYSALTGERFDFIFHCATHSQPSMFISEWKSTIRLNTNFLLDLLDKTNERLIFASSTEIYSGLEKVSTELDNGSTSPQHKRAVYIESKRLAEAACALSGIGRASRIAPAVGPYASQTDMRVVFELIRRGREHGLISLLGGHKNIRQYQYTGACVLRLLVSGVLGNELVYNNAGPYIDTLANFAKAIAYQMGITYVESEVVKNFTGAANEIRVSMDLFHNEFPEMNELDPSFDDFILWIINDYI